MIHKAVIKECKDINVLAICQKIKKNVAHLHFNIEVNGGNPKIFCNNMKISVRRAKRMKIWDLRSYVLCYVGYFSCLIL